MVFFGLHDRQIKHIADEVAAESVYVVTADFDNEVAVDVSCDVTADFVDEVEYAQSESPKDSDSTKIVLEVAELHLAPVSCVMRIVVEVCGDSLLSAVLRQSISEIPVALPILAAPWMKRSVGKLSYLDVVADAANLVIPTEVKILVWRMIRCYLGVIAKAANCVSLTMDEILAWGMMSAADATWMLLVFDEIVVADAASEIIAGATNIATDLDNDTAIAISTSKEISVVDNFSDMEDMAEVYDSCNVVLVGGYEQENVIDTVDLTAIISQDKECEPRRADASNNIGMKKDEDVDVTKAIGLVVDVMADALIVDLFNLTLRILRWTSREKFVVYSSMTNRSVVARLEIFLVFATTSSKLYYWEAPLVEEFPVVGEIFVPEEVRTQSFMGGESVADLGVTPEVFSNFDGAVDHGMQAEGTSASAAATPVGGKHLDNIGTGDAIHMSEGNVRAEATGKITAIGHLSRSTVGMDPNVGIGTLSSEIADFLKEFDRKTPNPHLE
uniref:Uncharacterized protein n=1 Tax=Fagus sylvatica TaxID=28930 RepID=A0A2N9HF19_FAGSY